MLQLVLVLVVVVLLSPPPPLHRGIEWPHPGRADEKARHSTAAGFGRVLPMRHGPSSLTSATCLSVSAKRCCIPCSSAASCWPMVVEVAPADSSSCGGGGGAWGWGSSGDQGGAEWEQQSGLVDWQTGVNGVSGGGVVVCVWGGWGGGGEWLQAAQQTSSWHARSSLQFHSRLTFPRGQALSPDPACYH